jgi:VWFA-related protein
MRVTAGVLVADRAALLTFTQAVDAGAGLTADLDVVRAALDRVQAMGDTALVNATFAAITLGQPEDGRTLAIVFSDGVDSSSWLTPGSVLETAARASVVVYGVTVGSRQPEFLHDVAARTGGRVLDARSPDGLRATFLKILEEFRHRYLLGYTPQGVSAGGWHRIDVRLRGRSGTVRARPGYQRGPLPPPPRIASAARWPETTALSIVPGRPVSVQSPAR